MQHFWFFNFDKKCKQSFPLWFQKWWHFFGPINDLFPDNLQQAIKHFTISSVSKMKGRDILLPLLLHFCVKYKIPWICRLQYTKKDHILIRQFFVKWWDKFPHTNDIISRISVDFPLVVPNLKDKQEFPSPTPVQALITYPAIPGLSDQASSSKSKSSSSKQKKKSSSAKKKDSTDSSSSSKPTKQDLLLQVELLKKSIEGASNSEDSDKESEASSADSAASAPYSNVFGHDSEDYPPRLVKHFVGTPSNITNRISDYLNNLRCNKMSDYRWYKDVFMSCVMLREDSQKPYWKEKFIDELPRLFAIKVKDSLIDITGYLNYDNYTYGDIVSMIQKLGISMCNDQRMIAQQMKDRKKAKYEMGNFCEQFGLPPIAPSVQRRKSSKKFEKPRRNYNRSREEFYKKPVSKSVSKKKPFHKKISKTPAKGTCFNCGQPEHYANKCTKKPQGFKKKFNELNINVVDQEDLFRLLEHGSPTSSDDDELSSSGSDYHSDSDHINSPNIKRGREQGPVLSKEQEHENMLLSIISQIQDPELKEKYLKKLKETMTRKEPSTSKGKISFEETLGRFQKQKLKDISLNDLQHEVSLVKREITELREEIKNLKYENAYFKQDLACLKLDKEFDHDSPSGEESNQSDHAEPFSPTKEICLVHRSVPQKWFCLVEIVVNHEYRFSAVALIDSGADLNCIREGLVPTSYFEKSEENLFSANGSKMKIRYELNTAHVCQDNVCFKIPSVLVKNLTHDVILGMPFLNMIYPFLSEADGITTDPFGQKIKFKFASKFEHDTARRSVFLLSAKRKHLDFLKQEIKFKRVSDNLHDPLLRSKIEDFQKILIYEVCSKLPNAFWHRKKHVVSLPYVKNFLKI
ncbi:hypothetical protein I3760_06G155300 [Carya illinoinensis]|nr:hypothetical protein I3760_06G155300 [Carya illinoinensis]